MSETHLEPLVKKAIPLLGFNTLQLYVISSLLRAGQQNQLKILRLNVEKHWHERLLFASSHLRLSEISSEQLYCE